MPSTVVHVAFGLLVAAAVLGPYFDRRSLAVVAAAVVVVDLDTVTALLLESTHRALFHTLLVPLVAAVYLYAETNLWERSPLRERYGDRGVRVAWATVAAVVVSAIGLDLTNPAGVNLFYPLHDQFYALDGAVNYSTRAGVRQSFVDVQTATPEPGGGGGGGTRIDPGSRGSTRDYHVGSGIDPQKGRETRETRRIFPVVFRGWQLLLVVASVVGLAARARLDPTLTSEEPASTAAAADSDADGGNADRAAVRRVDGPSDGRTERGEGEPSTPADGDGDGTGPADPRDGGDS